MIEKELQKIYTSNLKRYRKNSGLSQAQLAEKTGMSSKFISYIESGREWGSFKTLVVIADALNVEPFQLLQSEQPKPKNLEKETRLKSLVAIMADILNM